jgi:hypothetical protein
MALIVYFLATAAKNHTHYGFCATGVDYSVYTDVDDQAMLKTAEDLLLPYFAADDAYQLYGLAGVFPPQAERNRSA